jgi:hypothetical protein
MPAIAYPTQQAMHERPYAFYESKNPPPELLVFRQDDILLGNCMLQVMIGLLALESPNLSIQPINVVLSSLSYRSLSLSIVGPLPLQLLGRQVRHASRLSGAFALYAG